jgi:hypothetical protein
MVAGAGGAALATMAAPEIAGPALAVKAAQVAIPAIGAAIGGGGAAAVQGAPPSEIAGAAGEQGALELAGQAVAWPVKAIGRRVLATPVAQAAREYLTGKLAAADAAVRGTRQGVATAVHYGREAARTAAGGVTTAKTAAAASTEAAQQSTDAATQAAAARWPGAAATPPPDMPATGQAVADVINGPVRQAKNIAGQRVEEAAQSGPPVNIGPVKDKLSAMGHPLRTSSEIAADSVPRIATSGGDTLSPAQTTKILQQLKDAGVELEPAHPLPGVLGRLQSHPDVVPFQDAHILKRALDEAVNWDSPAQKQVQQITKGIRGTLRTAMQGHAPYDAATAAYEPLADIFERGTVTQRIIKSVDDDPLKFIGASGVKVNDPTRLQIVHEALLTHAPAGGGAAEGQQAWDGVRSALTYKHLIAPGIEKFDQSLAGFHPEVTKLLYGDPAGQQVLGNLQQISKAYQTVVGQGEAAVSGGATQGVLVDAATERATAARAAANRTAEQGRIGVTQSQNAAGAARQNLKDFQSTKLAKAPPAGVLGFTQKLLNRPLGAAGTTLKYIMDTPSGKELLQWSSYSSARTQAMVRAITGASPGMALANIARTAGIALEGLPGMMPVHQKAATPPPRGVDAPAAAPPPSQ